MNPLGLSATGNVLAVFAVWAVVFLLAWAFMAGAAKRRRGERAPVCPCDGCRVARDQAAQLPGKRAEDAGWAELTATVDRGRADFGGAR